MPQFGSWSHKIFKLKITSEGPLPLLLVLQMGKWKQW